MNAMRRVGASVAAAALALLLAACGGLPTSGPVNAGQPITDDGGDSIPVYLPDAPAKDATPQQIVEGFIAAGSGTRGNWETAQMYVAPDFTWNPRAGVVIYNPGDRSLDEAAEDQFTLTVTPAATVDEAGELSTDTGTISLTYTVAQQSDGQWRITDAPQGIVLDRTRFVSVFGAYDLQFFDPTYTYLVPDTRWFPKQYASTSIAAALVNGGPSPWLEASVATAFTDATRLATPSVPTQSGVAAVSLQEGARNLDQTVLDRMQTQLIGSLSQAGVDEVDMLVDEQLLPADVLTVEQTRVDTRPLVRTADDFGFLSGDQISEIDGLSAQILRVEAVDIEVDATQSLAAVRDAGGAVLRVDAAGVAVLDRRSGLIAPSVDPLDYVWAVPRDAPRAVIAYAPDGTAVEVPGAWPGASEVLSQRVSRDGTRLAAVVRDGEGYAIWVAGIIRDRDGVPTGVGERKVLARLNVPGEALTWADDSTVVVLTSEDGEPYLHTQKVGGFDTLQRGVDGGTTAAGGLQSGGVRVRDVRGELYTLRGANWQHLASDIAVLAIQQGMP